MTAPLNGQTTKTRKHEGNRQLFLLRVFVASWLQRRAKGRQSMKSGRFLVAIVVLGMLGCASREPRATGNEVRLGPPDATLGELSPFGQISELPDGRVVIPQYATPVLLANLDDGTVDTLGRTGDGPGEYRGPSLSLVRHGHPGILEGMQHRITVWNPDGTLDSTIPIIDVASFELRMDTLGYLYAEQPSSAGFIMVGQEIDSTSPKDSTWIYRMHPPDAGRDTVARLHEIGWEVIHHKGGVMRTRRLYASPDQWGVLPDGTLWILRGEQNRVDRRSTDGTWSIGEPRAWTAVQVTDRDRVYIDNGWIKAVDSIQEPMADVKGPFQDGAVAAPDGEVWAQLNTVAGDSVTRYEIFPATGPSTKTVILPKDWKVVAVTAKHVYAVHEDEDGFQVIERMGR